MPDGSRTHICCGTGNPTDFTTDLAYDSVHSLLYGWSFADNSLYTIDPATGHTTVIAQPFGPVGRLSGAIGYDWANQTLYFLNDRDDSLYSFDTTTGAPTLIGPTGVTGVAFVGLADLPVPEPSTAVLIAMGVGAFVLFRSRVR
jgi:DNA-binding beta-propeller fold protein YncE